jgi:hypothetical protein
MSVRAMLAAVTLALAMVPAARAEQAYSPPEGDFSVAFPAAPTVRVRPAVKSHDIGYRSYVDEDSTGAFVVAVDEYPPDSLPQLVDAGVYDHFLRNRAESASSQLVSTRPARLSGKPCLEGTFKGANDVVEVVRVLKVGDRVYELTYAHADGAEQPGAAQAFFASFKLTP